MLLKVRLPTSIPQMSLSMTDVDLTLSALPSSSTILLSMVAVFVLLSFVRALFIGLQEHLAFVRGRKALQMQKGPSPTASSASTPGAPPPSPTLKEMSITTPGEAALAQRRRPTSSWLWGLVKWDTLPAFPVDVTAAASPSRRLSSSAIGAGAGVGLGEKGKWKLQEMQQVRRSPPNGGHRRNGAATIERPLATLYQTDMPVSMAKMIMSRHTFRRPTSRPPPARAASVQIQVAPRRTPSPPAATAATSPPTTSQITSPTQPPSTSTSSPTTTLTTSNNNNPTNSSIPQSQTQSPATHDTMTVTIPRPTTTTNPSTTTTSSTTPISAPTPTPTTHMSSTMSSQSPPPKLRMDLAMTRPLVLSKLSRPVTPPSPGPSRTPSPTSPSSLRASRSPSPTRTVLGDEERKILEDSRARSTSPV